MADVVITVVVILLLFIGLPFAVLVTRDWLGRSSQKQIDEYARRFLERLQNPDIAALERRFGHSFPRALKSLYADRQEVLRSDFEVAASANATEREWYYIAYYEPADSEAEAINASWSSLENYFAFANDGCGNQYVVDPTLDDPPILFLDHEDGKIELVCDHLSDFITWPRREATA